MSLKNQIEADIKKAMLAKQKDDLRALRGIKSMILLAETEKGSEGTLSEEQEMKLLQKAAKQRSESLAVYQEQGREDLAQVEQAELDVINRYLPKPMSDEELQSAIKAIIERTGATSMKDMGKVMGIASKELAGKADGKLIADTVKSMLS
jgi:uncharacterized protein YqeY